MKAVVGALYRGLDTLWTKVFRADCTDMQRRRVERENT